MAKILASTILSFANIAAGPGTHDDDSVDQLNHWASVGLLLALAAGTGAKQFVGVPVRCWIPSEYKKDYYQDYADNYCWVSQMYYVPFSEPVPFDEDDRYEVDISFYRWVTLMFLLQALLYKLPNLLWRELKGYSGLNVQKIVDMVQETSMMMPDERHAKLKDVAVFMHRWLKTYCIYRFNAIARFREKFSSVLFCFGKRSGTYLTGLYMFIKILYVANSIGQFFLLSVFLGLNFWGFGIDAMNTFFKEGRWQDHYTFPRIGMCDYKIRQMTNLQTFSVQCVLSINLFLEKIYLLIWFWMIGILAINIVSLLLWLADNILPQHNETFIFQFARMMSLDSKQDITRFRIFAFSYLKQDGMFILRMVSKNTTTVLTSELVQELWTIFLRELDKRGHSNGGPVTLRNQPSAPLDLEEDVFNTKHPDDPTGAMSPLNTPCD